MGATEKNQTVLSSKNLNSLLVVTGGKAGCVEISTGKVANRNLGRGPLLAPVFRFFMPSTERV